MEFNFISVTIVSVSEACKANMDVLTTILHTAPETMSRGRSKRVWAVRGSGCGAASLHEFAGIRRAEARHGPAYAARFGVSFKVSTAAASTALSV